MAKLVLFGMAEYVPLENVWSASGDEDVNGGKQKVGSDAIAAAKKEMRKAKVLVIGAKGKDEEELASMHRATFCKLASAQELKTMKATVDAI